jgi:hypothetical protein
MELISAISGTSGDTFVKVALMATLMRSCTEENFFLIFNFKVLEVYSDDTVSSLEERYEKCFSSK